MCLLMFTKWVILHLSNENEDLIVKREPEAMYISVSLLVQIVIIFI